MQNDKIRFIDLFSGIGGFRLGLEKTNRAIDVKTRYGAGMGDSRGRDKPLTQGGGGGTQQSTHPRFRCVWSCDNNKYANQIYTKQFGGENHHSGDIRRVNPTTIPDFDLLCSGFPCQAFSVAGKRKGFQDTRGTLFFEICRIAEAQRPHLLLLENVKGLLNHDRGRTFTVILQTLDELGYWIEWQVLNSKHFGVPQNRERVFIVGHLRGTSGREVFPIATTDEKTSQELRKVGNIAETGHDSIWGRVYDPEGIAMNVNAEGGGLGAKTGLYLFHENLGKNISIRDEAVALRQGASHNYQGIVYPEVSNAVDQDGYLRFGQRPRDEQGKPQLIPIGYRRIRRLTPVECERLQGFPDGWTEGISDTQRYKSLGNAVTVNVIEFLGHQIHSSLSKAS